MKHTRSSMRNGKQLLAILAGVHLWLIVATPGFGHGALSGDADTCVLDIGPFKMHFTGYQPGASGNQEFCEDIPAIGRTIIVLESIDDQLREMQIAARIVAGGADGPVEMEQSMRSNARGSITLMHTFEAKGAFTGLVTVRDDNQTYVAEFPFSVGLPPEPEADAEPVSAMPAAALILVALGTVCLIGVLVFVMRARRRASGA